MKPRRVLGSLLTLGIALGLGLVAGLAPVPSAHAVTGSPPVTAPDSAVVYQGNLVAVQPVNNDSDPDNEQLTICRIGAEHYKGIQSGFFENEFDVLTKPSAKPGTYTFTYYACDFSYLTAGTITVTVLELPKIKVKAIANRPGAIRVTNPADFKIRFLYGSFKEDKPDGSLLIGKDSSVVIKVHRTRIDWVAYNRKGTLYLGTGHVTGIDLPSGDRRPTGSTSLPTRLAQAWRAS